MQLGEISYIFFSLWETSVCFYASKIPYNFPSLSRNKGRHSAVIFMWCSPINGDSAGYSRTKQTLDDELMFDAV